MQKSAGILKAVKPSNINGSGNRNTITVSGATAPAIGAKQWNKPDALNRKEVQGGHGSPAAFLITLPKSLADAVKMEGSLNPSKPLGKVFLLPKDPRKELEFVDVDINSGIELLGQQYDAKKENFKSGGDLMQSTKPAAPFLLMKEGPDAMRIMARGCGHAYELKQHTYQLFESTLDEEQHQTRLTQPLKAGEIKDRDHAVKIARGLKGRRTLQSYQIKDLILEKFHAIEPGADNEYYLERSAIFGCEEFEGQPEQAIKEEVSKLCNYMSNGERKGFYELKKEFRVRARKPETAMMEED